MSNVSTRSAWLPRVRTALLARRWELLAFIIGVALRIAVGLNYNVETGFDQRHHWGYVELLRLLGELPPRETNRETYHGPLAYLLYAGFVDLGVSKQGCGAVSAAMGIGRLSLVWFGLARWLPQSTAARVIGLFCASVLPVSLHLEGMLSNEPLLNLLGAAALVLGGLLLEAGGTQGRRAGIGAALGVVVGAALLTKMSILIVVAALGPLALIDAFRSASRHVGPTWFGRRGASGTAKRVTSRAFFVRRLAPWIMAGGLAMATSGWWFLEGLEQYGTPAPTPFELNFKYATEPFADTPIWRRRPPSYVFGWSTEIHRHPFYPTAADGGAEARFWPVLIASTYTDYYNHTFVPISSAEEPHVWVGHRPMPTSAVPIAIASANAGVVLSLMVAIAWLVLARRVLRQWSATLALWLLAPALCIAGQLFFAIRYPIDMMGVLKSTYIQFGSASLCAVLGVAIVALWQPRPGIAPGRPAIQWVSRGAALLGVASLLTVAVYSTYAMVVYPLLY